MLNNFYRLIQGDCLKVLPTLEDESVDLVLTDPPYGISYTNPNRTKKFKLIEMDNNLDWLDDFIKGCSKILKNNSHFYCFSSNKHLLKFLMTYEKYFKQENILAIKQRHSSGIYNPYSFRYSWDAVIFGGKGRRKLNEIKLHKTLRFGRDKRERHEFKVYYNDFIDYYYSNEFNLNLTHPTQKDEELIKFFILLSSNENDTILDPFLGSGTTMKVAQDLGRSCIGIEINPEYCKIIKKRCFNRRFINREVENRFEVFGEPDKTEVKNMGVDLF